MTNAEARFNNSLRPRKPEGSLGRTAQDGHLDSHTAPELSLSIYSLSGCLYPVAADGWVAYRRVSRLTTQLSSDY